TPPRQRARVTSARAHPRRSAGHRANGRHSTDLKSSISNSHRISNLRSSMSDCLFCRIISGEIKGSIAYRDDDLVAITDINPQAPLHVLIMPRQHIATINDLTPANDALVGSMFRAAAALARQYGYAER